MASAASPVIRFRPIPSRSLTSISAMRFCERLKPMARRSSSASPPVKPATAMAIRSSCSWKSGTPRVRARIGSRLGWGYVTGSRPARRFKYGWTIFPTIGPGRMIATSTTRS